ncbi:MAG TPA: MerR family transcriptional regulator [Spirochaetia bacterium]|nr:MerR family transcriptional regulator [Spirochaetia bacterium]
MELTQEEYLHRLRITPEELDAWLEHELVAPLAPDADGRASTRRFAESAVEEGELIRKFSALGYSLPEIQKIKRSVGLPVRDEQGRLVSRSDLLTIGELAEKSGINVRTIKFWEEKGLISPHRRTEGGFRLYKPGDVVVLSFVKDLQSFNYTLAEIGTILGLAGPDLGVTDNDLAGRPEGELEKTAAALEYLVERMREMRDASVRVETVFARRLRAVTKAIRSRKR